MGTPLERILDIPRLPARRADTHKGDFGRVLIVAGSRGLSGAAILCGRGALRGGAGLVTVACPADVQNVIAAGNPCYMTADLPDHAHELPPADVIAVGPGLGRTANVAGLVRELVTGFNGPLVIDADALTTLVPGQLARSVPAVLTPHPGEFARLVNRPISEVQAQRELWLAQTSN